VDVRIAFYTIPLLFARPRYSVLLYRRVSLGAATAPSDMLGFIPVYSLDSTRRAFAAECRTTRRTESSRPVN
jgi:hypothetical protein